MGSSPPTLEDCPFPEVAESLRPYIKTRQEAARIRKALHSTLPISPLHTSHSLPPEDVDPSSLSGVRKAYWRALEAHRAAQVKYDSLKTELEQLVHHQTSPEHDATATDDDPALLAESYIPLLHQREKHRKLAVIDKTSAKIQVTGGNAVADSFDKVTKRKIGELPAPPSTSAFERETGSYAEFDLTGLKQAILSTKQQIREHEAIALDVADFNSTTDDPQADLRGLQKAHNELTTWMETQLALISDVNGSKDSEKVNGTSHETNESDVDPSIEIESLYDSYLDARQRLLSTVSKPRSTGKDGSTQNNQRRGSENPDIEQRITTSEVLLPYLPNLMAVKENEQTLLHQGAYTRRQLASAESQTQAVLTRLADESHLIEPGRGREAPKGRDWREAAETAAEATNKSAMQRLNAGKTQAKAASTAVETIRGIPASLDSFLG